MMLGEGGWLVMYFYYFLGCERGCLWKFLASFFSQCFFFFEIEIEIEMRDKK